MTETASCPWESLLPELRARIASMLPPNEVACTFRLINKATSREFDGCICVRLSKPVPHHVFVRRWVHESAVRGLTFKQRQQVLCLTARSGVIANLEVAAAAMGCGWTYHVLNAAAEGGHLVACVWLLDRDCPRDGLSAIVCAARGGHTAVVRWLLARFPQLASKALMAAAGTGKQALCEELMAAGAGPERLADTACLAAGGGHVELTEWLLGQVAQPSDVSDGLLLLCAARGFELPALQRLFHSRLGSEAPAEFRKADGGNVAAAALCRRTPDWRAKLEWLETVGCRLGQYQNWDYITKRGDAVERVVLLQERGLLDVPLCLRHAVVKSNLSVIRHLRSEGLLTGALLVSTMITAMEAGNLAVLAELLAAGCRIGPGEVHAAVRSGHLHVLHWMEGPEAGPAAAEALREAVEGGKLAECVARIGSLELMEWLWERGCPSNDERIFTAAARAGSVVLLERLAVRGCPMSHEAYLAAGRHGDLATLRCLRRLDCPWGPDCTTFDRAVHEMVRRRVRKCSLEVLRWLVAEGCPVDWQSAGARAQRGEHDDNAVELIDWIESHLR